MNARNDRVGEEEGESVRALFILVLSPGDNYDRGRARHAPGSRPVAWHGGNPEKLVRVSPVRKQTLFEGFFYPPRRTKKKKAREGFFTFENETWCCLEERRVAMR